MPEACRLWALDRSQERMGQVEDNLQRLGLNAELRVGDAARPHEWWDGEPFDRILLDAPCSATGVIRRHPDIKVLRRPDDIPALAELQAAMLDALWPLLLPGGVLLYCTCSVLPQENEDNMQRFLATHPDASASPIDADWGMIRGAGRQVLPGGQGMDGFYYARLFKARIKE
jgi:16S rRNA (cytosine967-C5)-methyltransferase